jgi:hypothetical protein
MRGMWLRVERECWIEGRPGRRGSENRSLRRGCLRPTGLRLLRSHRLGLRVCQTVSISRYSR